MATLMRETRGRVARVVAAIQLRKGGFEFVVEVVVGLLRACPAEETKSTPAGYGNGGAKTRNDELNCGSEKQQHVALLTFSQTCLLGPQYFEK